MAQPAVVRKPPAAKGLSGFTTEDLYAEIINRLGEDPNRDIARKKYSPDDPSAKNRDHQRPPKQPLLRERGAAEHGSGVE